MLSINGRLPTVLVSPRLFETPIPTKFVCLLNRNKKNNRKSLFSSSVHASSKKKTNFIGRIPQSSGMEASSNFVVHASAKPLENADQLIDSVETFIFDCDVPRRKAIAMIFSTYIFSRVDMHDIASAQQPVGFGEYIDTFDGYSFKYPQNWIQVRGAGADVFFRDPFVLDENLSVELSSPSSSRYKSVEDLGSPQEAGDKVLRQYLTEFMSTRIGVRRESNILSTSSRVADDGRMYYQVEVNIKSYANDNELAVMPQDRVVRLEWDRRYLSVLGVENKRLYELRLQTPENVFAEEEYDLRQVMDSFRVNKVNG